VSRKVKAIREQTPLPVGVGFGISTPQAAADVAEFADAVVVGSALVRRIADLADNPEMIPAEARSFMAALRAVMDVVPVNKISGA